MLKVIIFKDENIESNIQIRQGLFETNSSSSHSLSINEKCDMYDPLYPDENGNVVVDSTMGTTEFGWANETFDDVGSKIIYAYLQALYSGNDSFKELLNDVIIEHSGCKNVILKITLDYEGGDNYGYIDHQSCICEDPSYGEIFESKDKLKNFLFNSKSYIETGNDNDGDY